MSLKRAQPRYSSSDAGATLILVMMFLLVGGLLIGALATASTNYLINAGNFGSSRSLQSDATSAINSAIGSIRYTPLLGVNQTLNASPPASCFPNGNTQFTAADGQVMSVWCTTSWNPASSASRVVTLSSCPGGTAVAVCAANPLVQAEITFDDYPAGSTIAASNAACAAYCGTTMTVNYWAARPVMPTVSQISPTTGPIYQSTPLVVTITGSGFVTQGTTVNFVEEFAGVPVSDNTVLPATNVVVSGPTKLTADVPTVTEGTTYFITVTTPTGTSAYSGSDVFTYTQVTPTISSVTTSSGGATPGGGTNGGTAVTIYGTGFYSGDTVNFIESNSSDGEVTPVVSVPANNVSISDSPSVCTAGAAPCMVAVSPAITQGVSVGASGSAYYPYLVTVQTSGGQVAMDATSTGIFEYNLYYPIVTSISPTSSGSSTWNGTLTVNGLAFFSGDKVCFDSSSTDTDCSQGKAVTPQSISATQITVTPPAISATSASATDYVEVTTPNIGTSQATSTAVFSYVPTVTGINPSAGTDGTTVTVTGTNFVSGGVQVVFVQESNGVAGSQTAAGTSVSVTSTTQLTVKAPTSIISSTGGPPTYYIEVTTGGGTSQASSATVFTYAPTVSHLSPTSGNAGTSVVITGTEFISSGLQVTFFQETNGTEGTKSAVATTVTVNSTTQITVKAPTPWSGATTSYVVVTTSGGSSATSSSDVFTY